MSKGWITKGEAQYLQEDSEWYAVALDIADLISSYSSHPITSDPKEYAARAIRFVLSHQERALEEAQDSPSESHSRAKKGASRTQAKPASPTTEDKE